ncbi:endopeptidase La [Candidatus Babela massiliensis]|uniref:Lon protease n=1 Tax=Candidatus Babela massiliensis TaxID=673862 RepID=V6DFK3_9BACT|nr:endopeptidase La [Candidatus Babela massiliensis]CDK30324.1 ATP-dependent Lon protease bacterial type [Candidatus Babela massiliensis]
MNENEQYEQNKLLALLPLKNVVILPRSIIPIIVGRASSIEAVEYSLKNNKSIFITAQKHSDIEHPTQDDVFEYGTRSTVLQVERMSKGTLKILVEGICRSKLISSHFNEKFLEVEIQDLPTTGLESTTELEASWRQLKALYATYAQLNTKIPTDLMALTNTPEDMDIVSDTLAIHLNLTFDERQQLLELYDLKERIIKLCAFLKKEIDILETEERIRATIQKQVEKNQREYYLNEQIKAIQKELGKEDISTEISQIRSKVKTLGLTQEASEKVEKELKRLEQMPSLSSEAVVSRHYIDWIMSLPWSKASRDTIGIEDAERILNEHHAGLKKAKERIIEFLAAKKFSKSFKRSPVICLIGPPGVGKTSLAKSVAESLGREFVRISLGGVKDEAEIRGHRRTYIGSMPGKIIQAMRKAKTINPVILLDEIDKMASDYHGDPSAALLEVLDPEQNKNFMDHFLEIGYDLSQVLFITTANHVEGIPYPLYDRMDKIILSGYTEVEKVEIARSFLIPKNLKEYGLKESQFVISDDILKIIISEYTRESGVRQLERLITKLMRKVIQVLLKDKKLKSVTVDQAAIKEWLGYPIFKRSVLDLSENRIGVATGLAWTEVGGDVLEIEVTAIAGKGGLTLTGQLGEVMQESAHAALSYIRSRGDALGLKDSFTSTKDIHVHIPEGATPKDGPSAGITMCVALVSALTKNPTKPEVAMTGEITLRGRVLGVGGLKEKILAARQYGMKTVLVPEENRHVVEEVMKDIGESDHLNIIFVSNMDEVLRLSLGNSPFDHEEISQDQESKENGKNGNSSKVKKTRTKTKK